MNMIIYGNLYYLYGFVWRETEINRQKITNDLIEVALVLKCVT